MPGVETGQGGEVIEGPEREAGEPHHIIVVDDRYSENLAGVFSKREKGESKTKITQAKDLESALDAINSVVDSRGVGVITDMFMPEKEGTFDSAEGLEVIREIFEFYGVKHEDAQESIAKVKAVFDKYGGKIHSKAESTSRSRGEGGRTYDDPIVQELMRAFKTNSPSMETFCSKPIAYIPIEQHYYGEDETREMLEQKLLKKDEDGNLLHTIEGFEKIKPNDSESISISNTGEHFIDAMSIALTWGKDGGILAGVRIAEAAHQKGLPVVVISGGHDIGWINPFIAQYLYDRGIIDKPIICPSLEEYLYDPKRGNEAIIRKDAQDIANKYSYFDIPKGASVDTTEEYGQLNIAKLKIVKKSLDAKISQKLY